jgi:hypothetical protein
MQQRPQNICLLRRSVFSQSVQLLQGEVGVQECLSLLGSKAVRVTRQHEWSEAEWVCDEWKMEQAL